MKKQYIIPEQVFASLEAEIHLMKLSGLDDNPSYSDPGSKDQKDDIKDGGSGDGESGGDDANFVRSWDGFDW